MYIFTGPETLPDPLSGQLKQLDYWTTLMFPSEDLSVFLFIRGIKVNPDNRRYTAARAIKEQAYAVHDEVVRIVTKMEIEEWELPKEKPETLTRDMSMRIMLGQL